jgi:hypothetical protein
MVKIAIMFAQKFILCQNVQNQETNAQNFAKKFAENRQKILIIPLAASSLAPGEAAGLRSLEDERQAVADHDEAAGRA